jgi:hypothetical protein
VPFVALLCFMAQHSTKMLPGQHFQLRDYEVPSSRTVVPRMVSQYKQGPITVANLRARANFANTLPVSGDGESVRSRTLTRPEHAMVSRPDKIQSMSLKLKKK